MIRAKSAIECRSSRQGAALVEGAVVLGVLMTILLGSLDLSLAVIRHNSLAEAARRLARSAIVRGEDSSALFTPWGPTAYEGAADEDSDMAETIRTVLVAVEPAQVRFQLTWPDGGHATGDRVETVVRSTYQPLLSSLFGREPFELQARSSMSIEH